jgi:hypothetical protein
LQGTNTLAYYENPQITAVKSFIGLTPGLTTGGTSMDWATASTIKQITSAKKGLTRQGTLTDVEYLVQLTSILK